MAYSGLGGGGGRLSAVDAILAEAADLVALEQIAKLNTAHLADDSALPSTLESRFRKLKSLPAASAPAPVKTLGRSATAPLDPPQPKPTTPQHQQPPAPTPPVQEEQRPGSVEDAAAKKENSPSPQQQVRPPVGAAPEEEEEDLERLFGGSGGGGRGRSMLRERNRGSRNLDDGSTSPPRQACCFGFSPKKQKPTLQRTPTKSKSKNKVHGSAAGEGGHVLGIDAHEWSDENRRMLTELKEQKRKLNKALQEQVEVSRETAKMARWVKQASARMTHTAAIDDLLSDDDDDEEFK